MKILAALGVISLGLMATLSSAQTMNKYGDCTIYPQKNKMMMAFTPAIAGQLTVQVNLPAPLWYNGDTPDSIKSGAEYCMAANIASRANLSKVTIRNVAWDGLVAGQTKNFDLALSQISITPARQKVVTFSQPYFYSDIGVMVRSTSSFVVNSATIKVLRIGVQQGTTGESYASSPAAEVFYSETKLDDAPTANLLLPGSSFLQIEGVAVLRGAKNPDLARKFVDFMLTSPVQSDIPTQMWVYPVMPNITLNAVYRFADQPTGQQISALQPQTINANSARWLDNWTRVVQRGANPATLPLR